MNNLLFKFKFSQVRLSLNEPQIMIPEKHKRIPVWVPSSFYVTKNIEFLIRIQTL